MKAVVPTLALAVAFVATAPAGSAAVKVGAPAPAFTATDNTGKSHSLADLKGKWVVLEWHNEGCPYVRKHYGSGNMQKLQKEWRAHGVVWLSVISSAPGNQGHQTPEQSRAYVAAQHAAPTAVLLDAEGTVGRLYAAKTTPHMFVIDPNGVLVYDGAIDDRPTTDTADIDGAANYVSAALKAGMAGQPVVTPVSKPYGCSVKY